jgi:hypothetical protein
VTSVFIKTKKTRKIPVPASVATLVKRLMTTAPKGSGKPLFRNTKDQPWKRMTGVVRFLALKNASRTARRITVNQSSR